MTVLQAQVIDLDLKPEESTTAIPIDQASSLQREKTLQLIYSLQSSIDLKTIVLTFAQGVQSEVTCASVSYTNPDEMITINVGNRERHTFNYRLSLGDEALGELTFTRSTRFAESEVAQLEDLMCVLIYPLRNAIQHHRALQSALKDQLTQLGNRSALNPALSREVELARRHTMPLSVLALDLDHFKDINDNYGHATGDVVLKSAAKQLKNTVRSSDQIFRMGSEEFVILLTNTDIEGAILLGERLRKTVEAMICEHKQHSVKITISIGVSSFVNNDDDMTLLERADEALYRAKQQGSNQVCI